MPNARQSTSSLFDYLAVHRLRQLSEDEFVDAISAIARGQCSSRTLAMADEHSPDEHSPDEHSPDRLTSEVLRSHEQQIAEGDAAFRLVVEANVPLVITIAKRYWFEGVFLDDLVQAGSLGLLVAVRTFDPSRAASFATWATFEIRRRIIEFLAANQHPVRLPRHVHDRVMADRREQLTEDNPGQRAAKPACSIHAETGAGRVVAEELEAEDHAHERAEGLALRGLLDDILSNLQPRQRSIVVERYGMDGSEPVGPIEQAQRHGISREAVRLNHNKAIERLHELATRCDLRVWLEEER